MSLSIRDAICSNNIGQLRRAVENGDINWQEPEYGASPLYLAAERGFTELVSFLTDLGAKPGPMTFLGWTAFHIAAQEGRADCIRIMAAADKSSIDDQQENFTKSTAMILACKNGHVEVLVALLDAGACSDKWNAFGQGPAHIACQFGHVKCLQILLGRGADCTSSDNQGITPMDLAIIFEQPDCVGVLLARKIFWSTQFPFVYGEQKVTLIGI